MLLGYALDDLSRLFDVCESVGFQPTLIVDVGVGMGTPGLMSRFPKSRFVLVEPLKEFHPALSSALRDYNAALVKSALGSADGSGRINIRKRLESSSLLGGDGQQNGGRPVDVRRLDSLENWSEESGPILARICVLGAEKEVLDGGRDFLQRADLVVIECSCFRFRGPRQPILHEMIEYMSEAGYSVYDVFNMQYRPYDKALASVDVAFVRRGGRFKDSRQ